MTTTSIDLTPTWEGLVPALLTLLDNGDNRGRVVANEELIRMAKGADNAIKMSSEIRELKTEIKRLEERIGL